MKAFFKPLLNVVNDVFSNFENVLLDTHEFRDFVQSNGWTSDEISDSQLQLARNAINIGPTIKQIQDLTYQIQSGNASIETLVDTLIPVVKSAYNIVDNIQSISTGSFSIFPLNQSQFWTEFGNNIFAYMLTAYLKSNQKLLYGILHFTGIIDYTDQTPSGTGRIPYRKAEVNWDKIGDFFVGPTDLIKNRYNWASGQNINYNKLFATLQEIFSAFAISPKLIPVDDVNYQDYYVSNTALANTLVYQLDVPFFRSWHPDYNRFKEFTLQVIPAPKNNSVNAISGFVLKPAVSGFANFSLGLTPDLFLKGTGFFSSSNFLAFKTFPDYSAVNFSASNFDLDTAIRLIAVPKRPWVLFGDPVGTRLMVNGIETSLEVKGSSNDPEMILRIGNGETINAPFVHFIFEPGLGDNFINKILGDKPFNIDFGFTLMWSSKTGIGFEGNTSFAIEIPLNKDEKSNDSSFPLKLKALRIAASANNGRFGLNVGADINFDIGVVKAYIRDIGIRLLLDKQSGASKGLFNDLDLNLQFKPPTGIGIAIDADPVSGGGFLNFDESTSTYTGGLELNFSKISLKAIGILTTRMPDGSDGYSLLIIITAEFTPIQLGMGFTLNGVGGLLGLNRTMNTDRLRSGIKDNTLDSILFPQDIVKNANVIISNIGQAFPVKRDRFIIGPMAKIGWGTPTLLTIEIGILIEVPSPVALAIVGVIKALLPSDNNRIIAIQVNFLGVIDFGKKYLSFDASLFDSKILFFTLTGDMALRLYWGDKPNFLLSVGGFHPKFTPPPMNLPHMQRLALELSNSNNLKIRIETYFAVTSNSAQFGARVEARAKAWKIEAIGALWFDILFQFSPFYFNANMGAMFAIKMGSRELLSIHVELNLEGPNPWRAQGRASFKVLGVRVNVSFDKTFGQARVETIEMAELWNRFRDAVLNKDNWEIIGPDRSHQTVSFREIPDSNTELVIDPFGALKFNQKLVPLNIGLSKYGTAKIKDVNKFKIHSFEISDGVNPPQSMTPAIMQDYFARNEFFYMTDDEKLSRESYERFDSGFSIGSTDEIFISAYTNRDCDYEVITIDTRPTIRFRDVALLAVKIDDTFFNLHVSNNYVSESALSSSSVRVTADGPRSTAILQEEYFIMNKNSMQKVQGYNFETAYGNATEASNALAGAMTTNPADAANFIVINSFELQTL